MESQIKPGVSAPPMLASHCEQYNLIDEYSDKIKSALPKLQLLVKSVDLVLFIANLVENSISQKKNKGDPPVDKKGLVCQIYQRLFPLSSPDDLLWVGSTVQSLYSSGLIKKTPYSKQMKLWCFGPKKK